MLIEHKALLATIVEGEKAARALYDKGCRVEETVRMLRQAGNGIRDRIAHYSKAAKAEAAGTRKASNPKTEAPKAEGSESSK